MAKIYNENNESVERKTQRNKPYKYADALEN